MDLLPSLENMPPAAADDRKKGRPRDFDREEKEVSYIFLVIRTRIYGYGTHLQ